MGRKEALGSVFFKLHVYDILGIKLSLSLKKEEPAHWDVLWSSTAPLPIGKGMSIAKRNAHWDPIPPPLGL